MASRRSHRRVNLACVLTVVMALCATVWSAPYSGGTGTADDPYQIATAADLMALGETPADYDKHFILTADIDLDPNLPGGRVFDSAVIAPQVKSASAGVTAWYDHGVLFGGTPFTGVFDGNGHNISHLTIQGTDYLGAFGYLLGAEVRDLAVVDVRATGLGPCVGGLAGSKNGGTLTRCYSTGAVAGTDLVGGLVGHSVGVISQCYSTTAVRGGSYVGGLVGEFWGGEISWCYSTGAVSGTDHTGGLVGCNWGGFVRRSFWDTSTSGSSWSAYGTGLYTSEMCDIRNYQSAGWDFVGEVQDGTHDIWQMPAQGGYPVLAVFSEHVRPKLQGQGTSDDPYLISNALDLGAVMYHSRTAHYLLTAPIDLAGIRWSTAVIPKFAGTLDGNGQTISHLTIQGGEYPGSGETDLGLIGEFVGGDEIRDLGVVDVNIGGAAEYVGGLIGVANGHVTRCYTTGVVGGTESVGGLIGGSSATVTQCYSTVAVSGGSRLGGLVGYNSATVTQCFSTGAVHGGGEKIGGLVGYSGHGTVAQCYSTGAVDGSWGIGGLVGYNDGDSTVVQCYSTGAVRGYGGGLSAYSAGISASFWDVETSGRTEPGAGTGLATAQMQTESTFLGWADSGAWTIDEGKDYPRLWWEGAPGHPLTRFYDYGGGDGTESYPYQIYTAEHLNMMRFMDCDWDKHFVLNEDIDLSGYSYNQALIGHGTPFTGTFDGRGHTLSHLTITGGIYVGLFGQLEGPAEVKDLGVVDVNMTCTDWTGAGALAGSNRGGTLLRCYSTGAISGAGRVGGLVGSNRGGALCQCSSTVAVSGESSLGGLVGENEHGSVTQCYSTGTVRGESYIGGLLGSNGGTVVQCYSAGPVRGAGEGVGGLVGASWRGTVTTDCFWDQQTSGHTASAGGVGLTTGAMQMASTFINAGWDFTGVPDAGVAGVWWIGEGKDYPRLRWEAAVE